ncbi:U3 small nucleolar ribonucleoprotein protein MPP10 [Condylostylus longicornis]|uniref:U3 small nucleolar ribonucleoprotein protein MPP10 n=1 Tax=Condylostylus longicornis TaxID=2530218 RepID=UPI00244E10DE|nr:U3 small nucleolar ribonucleoprotein protein MPP10 [Condylostylus longicornis]
MHDNKEKEPRKALKAFCKKLMKVTGNAEDFLDPTPVKIQEITKFLKDFYNFTTNQSNVAKENNEILPELVLESMDTECIWQQLEIRNNYEMTVILENVSKALAIPENSLHFKIKSEEDESNLSTNGASIDQENIANKQSGSYNEENSPNLKKEKVKPVKKKKNKVKPSVVDDKFFKLSELDEFLTQEDKKEMKRSSKKFGENEEYDGIDFFSEELGAGSEVEEDEENVNYKDFFDDASGSEHDVERENLANEQDSDREGSDNDSKDAEKSVDKAQNINHEEDDSEEEEVDNEEEEEQDDEENFDKNMEKKQNRNGLESDSEDDNEEDSENESQSSKGNISDKDDPKSSYELRQKRLKERITELEDKALSEKPWQLKGEIKATSRPQNSLLEEVLEFDAGTRPAPIITQETNLKLEDIIRQRIKDQSWDDPERKVRPVNIPQDFRKKLVLDGEKSKESLAQIYEKEYQKQIEKLNNGEDATENEELSKEHKEIQVMMEDLFRKLDALSNFHFTPKPAFAEPKIITNTPAITIEEVAPIAVSDAQLLAPEEIKSGSKGDVLGKSERSKTDKNRERRHKKHFQKRVFKQKEERELQKQKAGIPLTKKEDKERALRNVIKNRNISKMTETSDKTIKSSKSFFNQLQGDTELGVKVKRKKGNKFGDNSDLSAKKLKL